jgi:hypothetical protein
MVDCNLNRPVGALVDVAESEEPQLAIQEKQFNDVKASRCTRVRGTA